MKKKKILLSILISLVIIFPSLNTVYAKHPAQEIMYFYAGELPYLNFVEPYRTSILALNELENDRHIDQVKNFLIWYFEKLNYPDRYGLNATVYDYVLNDDWETPTYAYDSIDGYSGLFLHLLCRYTEKTGDTSLAEKYWDDVVAIAKTIAILQEGDGLTIALVTTDQKYLADNCESYGGITAYLKLRNILGKSRSISYEKIKENIKNGILVYLYDKKNDIFSYVIEDGEVADTAWDRYYPDAYGQLFLIYYDVVDEKMQDHIWTNFTIRHALKEKEFPIEQRIMYQLTRIKYQKNK